MSRRLTPQEERLGLEPPHVKNPVLYGLTMTWDYEKDELTIEVPYPTQVVHRSTNDMLDGSTVIFRRRKPGDL
ncbi:hypothetical protein PBI_BOGOSYJAY_60 [Mycobacterium phage BogosyJay]|nr:hypothetical protein PBI_MAMINIAINA_60 [Mycobacterium phage Maminiaina]QFG14967.1 hypothetical protein PBI_BOGOSYJAY_60 [Mycobacterium phage BogosyJay]